MSLSAAKSLLSLWFFYFCVWYLLLFFFLIIIGREPGYIWDLAQNLVYVLRVWGINLFPSQSNFTFFLYYIWETTNFYKTTLLFINHCKCKLFPNSTSPKFFVSFDKYFYLRKISILTPKPIFQRHIKLEKRGRASLHLWKLPVIGMKRYDVWTKNIYFNIFPR